VAVRLNHLDAEDEDENENSHAEHLALHFYRCVELLLRLDLEAQLVCELTFVTKLLLLCEVGALALLAWVYFLCLRLFAGLLFFFWGVLAGSGGSRCAGFCAHGGLSRCGLANITLLSRSSFRGQLRLRQFICTCLFSWACLSLRLVDVCRGTNA